MAIAHSLLCAVSPSCPPIPAPLSALVIEPSLEDRGAKAMKAEVSEMGPLGIPKGWEEAPLLLTLPLLCEWDEGLRAGASATAL